jgi:hypothetical protein
MQHFSPQMPLTYVEMVFRLHARKEHHHAFLQLERFRVPSKFTVSLSEMAYGHTCTSCSKKHHLTINIAHAAHHSAHAPHLYQDGSLVARDDNTKVPFPASQAHHRAFQVYRKSQQHCLRPHLHVIENKITSQSTKCMQRITPQISLTYARMVLRQHSKIKLRCPFKHHKRIRVPSKSTVRLSNIVHDHTCTSYSKTHPLKIGCI